jgi:hypothetical protein
MKTVKITNPKFVDENITSDAQWIKPGNYNISLKEFEQNSKKLNNNEEKKDVIENLHEQINEKFIQIQASFNQEVQGHKREVFC